MGASYNFMHLEHGCCKLLELMCPRGLMSSLNRKDRLTKASYIFTHTGFRLAFELLSNPQPGMKETIFSLDENPLNREAIERRNNAV